MQMIKTVWPEWNIEKEIGQGSYGTVYKCVNEAKEYCAIKVISIPQSEHEMSEVISEKMSVEQSREYYKDIADDLIKEIDILKALKGTKNIVEIYDAQIIEKEDGIGWNILIRMELLTDFNTYISDKQLTEKDVIKLGIDLGNALSVCHKAKIIHRDIKPENILVDDEGNFKLGDFGVAKQMEKTQGSMSVKGTYNYMSPEVFAGKKCDGRADLYSLALVMYKLLNNNRLPFIDPNKQLVRYSERQAAFEKRINGEELPPVQGVSNELNAVILKACAFKPNDRQKDIDEFNKELGFLVEGKRITNKKSSKKILGMMVSVACIALITSLVYYFTGFGMDVVPTTETSGMCGRRVGWEYNVETGELLLTGKGKMSGSEATDYGWDKYRGEIEKITISDGITEIGDYAFANCDIMISASIPDSVKSINTAAFLMCESAEEIVIPESVTAIGDYAFSECYELTNLTIPDGIKGIGESAFYMCESVEEIVIPKSINKVPVSAFGCCENLISVTIPDSIKIIDEFAFEGCLSLKEITIPESVTTIGYGAFIGCEGLRSIKIPQSVEFIDEDAFGGCSVLESIIVDSQNKYYMNDEDGVLYSKDKSTLVSYPIGNKRNSYALLPETEIIAFSAFDGAGYIEELILPYGLREIGEYAFYLCVNMTSCNIPDSVEMIGDFAFNECVGIQSVEIPENVVSIGSCAFRGCTGLLDVNLSSKLKRISSNMFTGCVNLQTVTIGSGTTVIEEGAFEECSSLSQVYYEGTQGQWDKISIADINECLTQSEIICNA